MTHHQPNPTLQELLAATAEPSGLEGIRADHAALVRRAGADPDPVAFTGDVAEAVRAARHHVDAAHQALDALPAAEAAAAMADRVLAEHRRKQRGPLLLLGVIVLVILVVLIGQAWA